MAASPSLSNGFGYRAHQRVRCVVLLMVLSIPAFVAAAEKPLLRIGYVEFPPYEYQNDAGEAAGSFIELSQRVAEEAGYRVEFVYLPISRIYLFLQQGRIDVWPGLTGIPMLEKQVIVSASHPSRVELSAWFLGDTPPLTQFDDLRGKRLILISGYTYGGLAKYLKGLDDVELTYTTNHRSALDMLQRDRGDYLLDYVEPIKSTPGHDSFKGLQHSFVRERIAGWIFSRERPDAVRYRDEFDAAYQRLRERDGHSTDFSSPAPGTLPGFPESLVRQAPAGVGE
mgnify:FL=1